MIETRPPAAYLPLMVARSLVRILTLLALLVAPLGMVGEHAAMAMPSASAVSNHGQTSEPSAHCAEMGSQTQDGDETSPSGDCLDCAVTCSALPAIGNLVSEPALGPAMARSLALVARVRGLHPESDDPPPRTA